MQNDELQRTHAELEQSRTAYADLFDFAPVGYVVLNPDGMIEEANLTAATMLQIERGRLAGKSFSLYLMPSSKDVFRHHSPRRLQDRSAAGMPDRARAEGRQGLHGRPAAKPARDGPATARSSSAGRR